MAGHHRNCISNRLFQPKSCAFLGLFDRGDNKNKISAEIIYYKLITTGVIQSNKIRMYYRLYSPGPLSFIKP